MRFESNVLKRLGFRVISPTVLSLVQRRLYQQHKQQHISDDHHAKNDAVIDPAKAKLALYFADLFLLKDSVNQYPKELLVDAIWYVLFRSRVPGVHSPLLGPVVILFLAHRDNIDPTHAQYKTWFALRCKHGASLEAPWQVPFDPNCSCRVCQNTRAADAEEAQATQ